MFPLIILTIEDESSRDFMLRLYVNSVTRMYLEAVKYVSDKESAEDVVSDAVVKLVEKVDLLRQIDEGKRLAYAITTVRHMAYHHLRQESRVGLTSFEALEELLPSEDTEATDDKILKEQRKTRLRELLTAIPAEDRLLLEEKFILSWSDEEIAKTLGIRPNSVRMRLTRAKRRVADALTAQGFRLNDWV
ncbi:MAG: sigma-70 family RNA polymerase sigma factor [Oscillospiraceae bacterium]|nr:sigma-70 family RNA polymerase sigma factor [Oscillospiraceae bacterium]